APRCSPTLALLYDREKQKDNANRATLAVARKLLAYLMAVDRGQTLSLAKTSASFKISKIRQLRVTCYLDEFRRRTELLRIPTIGVDESVDRAGKIGPCKNVAAYRTVVLADKEGQHAMRSLKQFVKHEGLVFRSKRGGPLVENTILVQGLHPALKKLGLAKSGMHAFR